MSEQPGRYQRTTGGLIGSMIVLVLGVGAFVGFRSIFRDQTEYTPPDVDYASVVSDAAQAGIELASPRSLPEGWKATNVNYVPGDAWVWDIAMLTDDGSFVGLHQAKGDVTKMLDTLLDTDEPIKGDPLQVTGSIAPTWQGWSDSGGDHAYVAEVGTGRTRREVVVYGSASLDDLRTIVASLHIG